MSKKKFLIISIIALILAMLGATCVMTTLKPQLHKTFMLEILNVKIKK